MQGIIMFCVSFNLYLLISVSYYYFIVFLVISIQFPYIGLASIQFQLTEISLHRARCYRLYRYLYRHNNVAYPNGTSKGK